jgi:LPXTG-site transpeptidase (sortase) family protein
MEIPEDISKVGWYKHGAAPGSKGGTTVIVGHRDSVSPEPGAFHVLDKLIVGDLVYVRYSNYTSFYRVKKVKTIKKNNFYKISQRVFALSGKPKIKLISCIGPYDKNNGGYQNNIIVVAELLV